MKRAANKLVKAMQQKELTLALAESITCGLAAHKLAGVKGTSDVLKASVVCYTPEVKHRLMGVPKKMIECYTCESAQVTEALVKGLKKLVEADIYAAITGLAAPGGSEGLGKPVGTVFFSLLYKNKFHRQRLLFRGSPVQIRAKACIALYDWIYAHLDK